MNMNLRKTLSLCLALGSLSFLLSGCTSSSVSEKEDSAESSAIVDYTCISDPESEEKIFVILKNYHGDYWKKVIEGISSASDELDAAVYLGGIDNETDISGQSSLIQQAIEEGADGILLAPASSTSLVESCQSVKEQNIPLVLIDSSINSNDYDICYMTDNMDAGKMAAQEMLELLHSAGNSDAQPLEVGILLSSDTSQAMVNRVSGFLEYWSNSAPKQWEVAGDIYLNGGDVKKAQANASKLLEGHPQIKGLFGCNNTSTIGIVNTLLQENRTDVAMVGFDLAQETQQFILNSDYHSVSLLQNQEQMGYQGILSLEALIDGTDIDQKYFDTGVEVADRDYLMENDVS